MSGDFISREKFIDQLLSVKDLLDLDFNEQFDHGVRVGLGRAVIEAKNFSAADVRPVKSGKWEKIEIAHLGENDELCIGSMLCDQCHLWSNSIWQFGQAEKRNNFCPSCGARMEES